MDVQFVGPAALGPHVEKCYDALLGALGTRSMEEEFFSAVHAVSEVDRIYCFERRERDDPPNLFCSWVPDADATTLINRYRAVYHRFDPIRGVLPRIPDAGCASITFHASEIENSDYRSDCFDRFSIRHRLSIVKHVGDRWLTLSVARRSRPFGAGEVASLSTLSRLSLPLLAKNQSLQAKTSGGNFSIVEMERRLAAAGKGLTERERQVCARTIAGISAEGAALDLGISVASVLTYRQRAYRRANVSNAMQLAALVMH